MNIAFSPCPNDTFIFHALVHGLVPGTPLFQVQYADIEQTNEWARRPDGPDILKISYGALPWVHSDYTLLPCGGALGRGCGPLVLSAKMVHSDQLTSLKQKPRVAIPSDRSTAYLLFRLWMQQHLPGGVGDIVIMPFQHIMPALQRGEVDLGLVIHEARFTYQQYQLHMLADLGEWWEKDTGLPIPLGAIIVRRSLPLPEIRQWIRASLEYAWAHPEASRPYVMQHAQEMDPAVAAAHIQLYVNEFSLDLGAEGFHAINTLFRRAATFGFVPEVQFDPAAWEK
jgi:1,4-dihydroxy-6-naphthoate synthase